MTVSKLALPEIAVSTEMLDFARELREVADEIEKGKVRSGAFCIVESGPDMNVTSLWASMSGRITLTGGLFNLMQSLANQ